MVKVKEEAAMAEPKPAPFVRKNRHHSHLIHHTPFYHYPYHNCSFATTEGASDSNGATSGGGGASSSTPSPASFYIGPGFQPQSQMHGTYGAGPSQTHGSEHIVYFHVNPGVTINFQIGDNMQVLRGFTNIIVFNIWKGYKTIGKVVGAKQRIAGRCLMLAMMCALSIVMNL